MIWYQGDNSFDTNPIKQDTRREFVLIEVIYLIYRSYNWGNLSQHSWNFPHIYIKIKDNKYKEDNIYNKDNIDNKYNKYNKDNIDNKDNKDNIFVIRRSFTGPHTVPHIYCASFSRLTACLVTHVLVNLGAHHELLFVGRLRRFWCRSDSCEILQAIRLRPLRKTFGYFAKCH